MRYSIVKTASEELLDLASVKAHLRTLPSDTEEDDLVLLPLITAAREYCENLTDCGFIPQTIKAYPTDVQTHLPRAPITKITSVTIYHDDGTSETLSADSDYSCDLDDGLLVIHAELDGLRKFNPIAVEYEAGYSELPPIVAEAMKLLIGHWYANRESVQTGATTAVEIAETTKAILKQYRRWW